MVAGRFVMRERQAHGVDWESVRRRPNASRDRIVELFRRIAKAPIRQLWRGSFNIDIVN